MGLSFTPSWRLEMTAQIYDYRASEFSGCPAEAMLVICDGLSGETSGSLLDLSSAMSELEAKERGED